MALRPRLWPGVPLSGGSKWGDTARYTGVKSGTDSQPPRSAVRCGRLVRELELVLANRPHLSRHIQSDAARVANQN